MKLKNIILLIFLPTFLFACSDKPASTSYSNSDSYNIPSELQVAKNSDSSDARFASLAAFGDPGTDYTNHVTDSFLDSGMDSLDMINDVLKLIADSGYKDFVNKGPYQALIVAPGGDDNKASSSGSQGSSEKKVEKLTPMTVNVTRADGADEPMKLDFWMTMTEEMGVGLTFDINVKGHIEVLKGSNATTLPWGVFTFNVLGIGSFGAPMGDIELFKMGIKTMENADGYAEMEFIDAGSSPQGTAVIQNSNKVHVIANKALTEGNMRVNQSGIHTDDFYVTFNSDYYMDKQDLDGSTVEFSKKLADLTKTVYEYGFFNKATGAKISLNAGMPFKTSDGGFGYAGTWGIWAENQDLIVDGAVITSEGSTPVNYTVVAKEAKLIKHTKVSKTLADITGLPLLMWDDATSKDKVIKWNSASSIFQQVGTMGPNAEGNWVLTAFDPSAYVTLTKGNTNEWEGTWVESLSTYLEIGRYLNGGVALADSTAIEFYTESTVQPGDTSVPSTLYTKEWVPNFSVANVDLLAAQQDNHHSCWGNSPDNCVSPALTYDTVNYTLKNGSTILVAPTNATLDLTNSRFGWGVNIGGLVGATNGSSSGVGTYYSWNMGTDSWNKLISIKDAAGAMVVFDQPISMTYKHLPTNDRNYGTASRDTSKDNMLYQLEYDGTSLNIPWAYDASIDDWAPEINLKDGAILTDGATEYVVKASEVSMTMKMLGSGGSGLTVNETTSDPTITFNTGVISAMPTKPTAGSDGLALKVKVTKGVTLQ